MVQNPLSSHLSDSIFEFLIRNNLLKEKGVRDFKIRQRFYKLKEQHSTQKAVEILQEEYPYLQYETIRKIIYQKVTIRGPEFFYLF
ncbi:MAG: hypothetical protein JXR46_01470 [Calditrichaceae bacterium]|nr:hypothetical protein [Calditrichaceae bacterium]MBN2707687.1 hypothetical protein [Calditrichaceae bacterium]RQV96499.1 MAG: hypothetical protein EH224_04580 [Calditrichota bacterium]